ncbi:MAG: hypothetical protein V7K68_00895 [Nostoc sp.]|uniref:hypothetical protein n=1 Tax=Nostoc sp. TaxID=1180 RepID=UPI002FF5CB20
MTNKCPRCESSNIQLMGDSKYPYWECLNCSYVWEIESDDDISRLPFGIDLDYQDPKEYPDF